MAIHSSTLAWEIPWTEEPGGLQFMRSQKERVRHDLAAKEKQQNKMDFEAILLSEINQTEKGKYHMISQARLLEWVAISYSRGSSQLMD